MFGIDKKGGFSFIGLKPPLLFIGYMVNYPIFLTLMRYSAICTAFSAAPFLIWSPTIQNVSPLGILLFVRHSVQHLS